MLPETRVAIKVWDLPVRLFHWALALLFVVQIVTGQMGGDTMRWHAWSGYALLVLIVFRILWGFAGGTHARFASFLAGPAATWRFAVRLFSREAVPQVGHNPLGGWMVMALIVCLLLQAVSGLFSNDGLSVEGPLAAVVSAELSNRLSQFHRWNQNLLLALTGVHIFAVAFHWLVKRENLVGPMFSGVKQVPESLLHERREVPRGARLRRAASRENAHVEVASAGRAIVVLLAAIMLVCVVVLVPA